MARCTWIESDVPEEVQRMRDGMVRDWLNHLAGLRSAVVAAEAELKGAAYLASMGIAAAPEEPAARLDALKAEYSRDADAAHRAFAALPRAEAAAALTLHYIAGMPWKAVSDVMGYSVDGIMSMRARAVPLLWHLMPSEWRRMPRAA